MISWFGSIDNLKELDLTSKAITRLALPKHLKMKRIKSEEIQNSIKNYVLHRNLPANILESTDQVLNSKANLNPNTSTKNITSKTSKHLISNTANSLVDLNIMALNDLALIESSINDYYSFSFNSAYESDYQKQFEMFV
jgi:hypothetical protein